MNGIYGIGAYEIEIIYKRYYNIASHEEIKIPKHTYFYVFKTSKVIRGVWSKNTTFLSYVLKISQVTRGVWSKNATFLP